MDISMLLEEASAAVQKLAAEQTFEVRNLFQELRWESFTRGDRITLGKCFKNEVQDGRIPDVEYVGKKNNNHAVYIKK